MRRLIPAAVVLALALSARAPADTVCLKDGGEVAGKLTELKIKIGPLVKTVPGAGLRSAKCVGKEWEAVDKTGTAYAGALESVAIRCVAGVLRFEGKQVESIKLGEEPKPKKPPKKKPKEPAPDKDPKIDIPGVDKLPKAQATPEQVKQIKALLKRVGELRDEYFKKAKELRQAERRALGEKYRARWETACQDVKEKTKELGKHAKDLSSTRPGVSTSGLGIGMSRSQTVTTSPAAAHAVAALSTAQSKKAKLAATIKSTKRLLSTRYKHRYNCIQAYHDRIRRYLLNGKVVPEEAMVKAFDKALKGGR